MPLALLLLAAAATSPAPTLPAFMAGCWEHRSGDRWTQECWTDPRAGQMMGSSRSGNGEALRDWEWLRIEQGAEGALTYFASPRGRPVTPFTAAEASATAITFTNPAHDYPQRIRYEIRDGVLEAETSLLDGSNPQRWTYRRSGSPAAKD